MHSSFSFRQTVFALLLGALAGCNQSDSSNDSPVSSNEPINQQALQAAGFVTFGRGLPLAVDKIPASGNVIIRTAAEWRAAWAGNAAGSGVVTPMPEVDFGKYMVVGKVMNGIGACDAIGINSIEQAANALTVHSWVANPNPELACAAMLTNKAYFALLPQSSLPVQFISSAVPPSNSILSTQMQLQAAVYEDRTVKTDGGMTCTPLVTTFAVRGGEGFPQQFRVNAVAVAQDGVTRWLQPASASETGVAQHTITDSNWLYEAPAGTAGSKSEPVLRGVARGCTSLQFKSDRPVTVLLSVAAADGQAELVANSSLDVAAAVTH